MKRFQWLAVTAGMAALAACTSGEEADTANVEINAAEENLALPPIDPSVDVNADLNAGMNADTNATENATGNMAENTTNAY